MNLSERRVVVTGGAGFVASHVVDRLTQIGARVVVVDDLSVGTEKNLTRAFDAGARLAVGDIRDAGFMAQELAGADAVVHMACDNLRASLGKPQRSHEINATGTLSAILAAVESGVERFVYISSSEAYGSAITTPVSETHPMSPTTVYGAAKAAGELYSRACMRRYGLPVTIVRPFNCYGPRAHASGDSAEVIPIFVARILAGEPPVISGTGSQTRDFTWVEETAVGIVAAAASDELVGDAVNIAFGRGVSIREICDMLLDILGASDLSPELADERPGDVAHHTADTGKAKRVLGFEPRVAIREGLERYVEWVLAKGPRLGLGEARVG